MKLGPWICDTCGQPINTDKDGYVERLLTTNKPYGKNTGRCLHLVHNAGLCLYDQDLAFIAKTEVCLGSHANTFTEVDGLVQLLQLLHQGELPNDDVIEMIQRLHVPGYEQARPHVDAAINQGVIDDDRRPGFHHQSRLATIIEWAKNKHYSD